MAVKELTSTDFESVISDGVVLVDFWATWCTPCRMLGPILEELSEETEDVTFTKVDTQTEQQLAAKFKVDRLPTVILLKDGEEVDRFIGLKQKDAIRQFLDQHI